MKEEKKEDYSSDWAYSESLQKAIHISNADSGLNDYRCLGCHSKMQAVIQKKIPSRLSFFRHHVPKSIKEKPKCIRANKEYREKIAKAILNRLKYVNAPAIYKFPLNLEVDLLPMKIERKKRIEASYTKAELTFYEDENGVVRWGKNPKIVEKNLLIRPDITFFNKEDKPILFIEFIVTNKISQEKYLKLSRIGIDTLRINIPKKSEEDIEKALKSSRTYKWAYNERESNTEYIPVPRGNTKEFSQVNDNERIIFEEDFKCRQAEINQLIRSIERSLSSEQYRRIEYELNQQIQKVERNSERAKQRLEELEESNRKEALERNSEQKEFEDRKYRDLETRYIRKREALERDIEAATINNEFTRKIAKNIAREEKEIKQIEHQLSVFETEIRQKVQSEYTEPIERERREIENLEKKIRTSINRELAFTNSDIQSLGILYDDLPRKTGADFKFSKDIEKKEIERIREKRNRIEREIHDEFRREIYSIESKIKGIEREENNIEESVREEFNRELKTNTGRLSKRTRILLEAKRMGSYFKTAKLEENSYKRAKKFFNKGTWKKE